MFVYHQQIIKKELDLIKQIAVNNGYNTTAIDNILNKKLFKNAKESLYPPKT